MEGFLAIDVAKVKLDARLSKGLADPGIEIVAVPNRIQGYSKLLSQCKKLGITKLFVCMEATGALWFSVAKYFFDKGATIFVVNPARIKGQRKTEQKRTKTDRVDAALILRFMKAQLTDLKPWSPPSENLRELQSLVRYRETLASERTSKKNLMSSQAHTSAVLHMVRKQIKILDQDIAYIESEIDRLIGSDEHLRKQFTNATSVPYIARTTAPVIISELRAFAEVRDPRQATAFAGLDVVQEQSGTILKPSRISKQGNRLLRSA